MGTAFQRVIKKPFFGRFKRPFRWPEGVAREHWAPVDMTNSSGMRLAGLHARARADTARGIVVFPHPMVMEAKGWGMKSGHADLLLDLGFDVLTFDFNGFGDSDDCGFDFPDDIRCAGLHAAQLLPGKPVVLFGLSMGAGHGVGAMDFDDSPFKIAVLEGAFTTLEEFWRHFAVPRLVLKVTTPLMPKATVRMLMPIERARTVRGLERVLLVYGTKDRFTPPDMGERFLAALPLPDEDKSLWIIPDAKHLGGMKAAGDDYRARVGEFLTASCPAA